ncbi:hypothetical protein Misp01_18520 [Microtetraspora sp. NBRC 13810]|nr:hypothetical protein Misp01_18520 [Microtetraspora sp. NBRC 13810]
MGENGVEVESTTLKGRSVFRVTKDDYFVAYCATMEDVATFVSPDSLVELIDFTGWPEEPDTGP